MASKKLDVYIAGGSRRNALSRRVWFPCMSIGGENRVGHVTIRNVQRIVDQCGLEGLGITVDGCVALAIESANIIPRNIAEVFDGLEKTEVGQPTRELRSHMEKPIIRLCEKSIARLGFDG